MSELCLVTGGAGFIGSHLVEALAAQRRPVRVLDNLSTGQRKNLAGIHPAPELVQADLVDASDLAGLAPGDVIVLDSLAADPLRLLVGNCERFAGFPGTKGRKLALQVSGRVDDDGWVKTFEEGEDE